jgi:hypothetical protein
MLSLRGAARWLRQSLGFDTTYSKGDSSVPSFQRELTVSLLASTTKLPI